MKSYAFSSSSGALLALTVNSQAFANPKTAPLIFDVKAMQTPSHLIGSGNSVSSFPNAVTNNWGINMETNKPVITLGQNPEAKIFQSLTEWASTVTATTTITTLTTTVMVPQSTADMPLLPTNNVAERAKPFVKTFFVPFAMAWAVMRM